MDYRHYLYYPRTYVRKIAFEHAQKTTTGAMVLMVHLTNLANWRLDGTIGTDEELRRDWLLIGDT